MPIETALLLFLLLLVTLREKGIESFSLSIKNRVDEIRKDLPKDFTPSSVRMFFSRISQLIKTCRTNSTGKQCLSRFEKRIKTFQHPIDPILQSASIQVEDWIGVIHSIAKKLMLKMPDYGAIPNKTPTDFEAFSLSYRRLDGLLKLLHGNSGNVVIAKQVVDEVFHTLRYFSQHLKYLKDVEHSQQLDDEIVIAQSLRQHLETLEDAGSEQLEQERYSDYLKLKEVESFFDKSDGYGITFWIEVGSYINQTGAGIPRDMKSTCERYCGYVERFAHALEEEVAKKMTILKLIRLAAPKQ